MACVCNRNYRNQQEQIKIEQKYIAMELINPNIFEIGIPISTKDSNLTKGKYRFYFDITKLTTNQILTLFENYGGEKNFTFQVLGKRIRYIRGYGDKELTNFIVEIEIIDNPIPINALIYGLLLLFGTIGGYLLLNKVEKVIEISKPFALAITLFLVIVLINIFR